jgi:WS/DGAT/MGAT family acyltransferase
MMELLSVQDATFVYIENEFNHMSLAALGIFEAPAPDRQAIEAMLESKLHRLPRLRQRLRFAPLDLGRPAWCDDPHFSLGYHVRHSALPPPGSLEQLQTLVGRVMSRQLDRDRPLWELWVIENLEGDSWALLLKLHHCLADGVAATDLLEQLLDRKRKPAREKPRAWRPEEQPSAGQLARLALAERLKLPLRGGRALRAAVADPGDALRQSGELVEGLWSYLRPRRARLETSLNGPLGPHRSWRWVSAGMDEIRTVRAGLGGTVNDVALAAITRGFRTLLRSRGEAVEGRAVRSLVPVSVRREDEHDQLNNRVSAMLVDLPVGIDHVVDCLADIRGQMNASKRRHQAEAGEALMSLSILAPPTLMAVGSRLFANGLGAEPLQTVTTNVPGPRHPLYAAGSRMVGCHLYVPLATGIRIGVAMYSYEGQLSFAVTGDSDHAPDTGVLCDGIRRGIDELLLESSIAVS